MLASIIEVCVRKRVVVVVVVLALGAFGFASYLRTPIEAFPDVTNMKVTVLTQMPGLAPEEVERQLTVPLERVLNGTPGMIQIRSESHFGLSMVSLTFEDNADVFRSRTLVAERIGTADLPGGVTPRLAPDATPLGKVFQYRLVSDRHSATERRSEQDWTVSPALKQVPGVAEVVSFGGYRKEYHIAVDPMRLLAHDLTLAQVTEALEKSNQNVGGGILVQGDQGLAIRGVGYLRDPQELLDVVLRSRDGTPVTVRDVARLVQSYTPRLGSVGYGDDPATVEGYVLLRRGENPSEVLAGVEEKVRLLNDGVLPAGMLIEPFYNRTHLVDLTLGTVLHNLLFGAALVTGVVWLFLRSLRASLVVASVIPLAMLGAFIGLRAVGLPANLISVGAIDFGILVDAAVVLVENVLHAFSKHRPRTDGEARRRIVDAAVEVARPAFFAMAIIAAALVPIFTLERIEGRIFRPLAMTYAFALGGALALAFTLVPALCGLVMGTPRTNASEFGVLRWVHVAHARALGFLMARPLSVALSLAVTLAFTAVLGTRVGSEFLPDLDEGDLLVFAEMPPSISLEEGATLLTEMRRRMSVLPEVVGVLSEQGRPEDGTDNEAVNLGKLLVRLAPREEWRPGWTRERLTQTLRATLTEVPGVRYNFSQPIRDAVEESVSGARGKVVLKVVGTDLDAMRETLRTAIVSLRKVPGIVDLDLYRDATVPQVRVALDRPALARAGITVSEALALIETALGGRIVTSLWEGERPVDIRVRLTPSERGDLTQIGEILVPTNGGARIPLREIADITVGSGRASILREQNQRFAALKFNVEGRDMGSVVAEAREVVGTDVSPPPEHRFVWTGEFENQARAMARLTIVVPVCFLLVFALVYAAVQSWRGLLAVIACPPFAMTGGVVALWATGINMSVSAAVGFITLLGQACLASLLVVAAIDARVATGEAPGSAALEGAKDRLRAVLMTGLLAMLGLAPMAVSTAIGSETQRPFAVVIVGGLLTALPVTLLALPVFYGRLVRAVDPAAPREDVV